MSIHSFYSQFHTQIFDLYDQELLFLHGFLQIEACFLTYKVNAASNTSCYSRSTVQRVLSWETSHLNCIRLQSDCLWLRYQDFL